MKVRKRIFYFIKVLFSDIGVCVFRCEASMSCTFLYPQKKVHRHINTEEKYFTEGFSMKKLVSLLLAVCMCLSIGIMLTACGDAASV